MKITARQLNDVINLDMRIPDAVEKEVVDSCKIVLQKMLDSATFVCIVPDAIAKYIIKISKIHVEAMQDVSYNPRFKRPYLPYVGRKD